VYAIWSGVGIVLISLLGVLFFNNIVDISGILGLSLIIAGAIILNLFSKMSQ
jgi:small multidrug resistance pump